MTIIKLPGDRKVGHLVLHRQPREISSVEFNALSASERLEMVRSIPGRAKYDLLIEAADVVDLVQQLSAQEVFALVHDIGQDDVADLVEMVSHEQLTTFIDLDAWRGEGYDGKAALRWLTLLAESGEERLWEACAQQDVVSLALLFSTFITVTGGIGDLLEEDRLHQGDIDKIYQVDFKDSELAKLIGKFLDVIYRHDRDMYLDLMERIRTESGAELQEMALKLRNGRLLDQGIPDPESARTVYAYLKPESFESLATEVKVALYKDVEAPVPGNLLVTASPGQILQELFSEGLNENLAWEMACLVNKVLVASHIDVGASEEVGEGVRETYANLEIALGYLCAGDITKGRECLDTYYLEHLFRLGFSLLHELQRRALELKKAVGALLDPPYLRLIEGLAARRPMFYRGLHEAQRDDMKPFSSYAEVSQAASALEEIEAQRTLFIDHLGVDAGDVESLPLESCNVAAEDLTFSMLLLTAMANRILGREFAIIPLRSDDLPRLHATITQEGRLAEGLRNEMRTWCDTHVPGSRPFVDYSLQLWDDGLCPLEESSLDARYVPGLIVQL